MRKSTQINKNKTLYHRKKHNRKNKRLAQVIKPALPQDAAMPVSVRVRRAVASPESGKGMLWEDNGAELILPTLLLDSNNTSIDMCIFQSFCTHTIKFLDSPSHFITGNEDQKTDRQMLELR